MNVLPGTSFPNVSNGPSTAELKASKGVAQQFAAALRSAGLSDAPTKRNQIQQVLDPSSSDKPRPNLPRGSLVDIRV